MVVKTQHAKTVVKRIKMMSQ